MLKLYKEVKRNGYAGLCSFVDGQCMACGYRHPEGILLPFRRDCPSTLHFTTHREWLPVGDWIASALSWVTCGKAKSWAEAVAMRFGSASCGCDIRQKKLNATGAMVASIALPVAVFAIRFFSRHEQT